MTALNASLKEGRMTTPDREEPPAKPIVEDADRSDPRFERYLEYCAVTKANGLPCASFNDWVIQSEEGY